jgi:purine-binding chemotaxis protein CheW
MEILLTFKLGSELYAAPLARVRQIVPLDGVRRVPSVPLFARGVLDLDGRAVPVVDLGLKFGLVSPPGVRSSVVVVDVRAADSPPTMGFVVSGLGRVLEVDAAAIEEPPHLGAGIRVEFLRGLLRAEGALVLLLDLDRVLSATEIEALLGLDQAAAASAEGRAANASPGEAPAAEPDAAEPTRSAEAREGYLVVRIAREELALEVGRVREILECRAVTPVPGVPPAVRGAINVRGTAIPLLDLAVCIGRPRATTERRTSVVLVEDEPGNATTALGLAVDAVSDIVEVDSDDVEPAPSFGVPCPRDLLRGIVRAGTRFVPVLDLDRVVDAAFPRDLERAEGAPRP